MKDSVVFPDAVISDFSTVNGAIIGEDSVIGKRVKINRGCLLGDRVKIRDNVTLSSGVSVCPAKEVSQSVLKPKHIV
jgi:NDP-sugar pyrophosphorylase family protein